MAQYSFVRLSPWFVTPGSRLSIAVHKAMGSVIAERLTKEWMEEAQLSYSQTI